MPSFRFIPASVIALCLQACAAMPPDASPPSADGEVIPANEAAATAAVTAHIRASITEGFQREGHAFREVHRKAHGCVSAQFTVLDNVSPQLAHGVLSKPRSFDAVIRFSNGSQHDDRKGDARGMAIKLLGVDGPKLLSDEPEARTQDFLLMNHPVFFVRDAADYVGFQQATSGSTLQLLGWLTRHLFHESAILLSIKRKTVTNPLDSPYWSTTPSKLGPQAIKFSARPCAGSRFANAFTSPDLLRENMTAHLATTGACFDFMVQAQADPSSMPIEDPTIEWDANQSPFVPVARIQIPAQAPEQGEACEARSFTPWHTLAEHRPLGGISRVRKTVYQEGSRLRHQLNSQPRIEP